MQYQIKPMRDELLDMQFLDEQHKLRVNILLTSGWLKNQLSDILAQFQLTVTQYNVLRILNEQEGKPISTLHIREKMLEKMSDTPKIVNRLVAKGLAFKKVNKTDRRLVDVTITKSGLDLLNQILEVQYQFDMLTGEVSEEEARVVNAVLTRMRTRE